MGITLDHAEMLGRIDTAIRTTARIASDNDIFAVGGLLGITIQWMLELGYSQAQIHATVDYWFQNHSDVRAQIARMSMKLAPEEQDK